MHICPQEVMMVLHAIEIARPLLPLVKAWCAACVDGTHKSCADHKAATEADNMEIVHE